VINKYSEDLVLQECIQLALAPPGGDFREMHSLAAGLLEPQNTFAFFGGIRFILS